MISNLRIVCDTSDSSKNIQKLKIIELIIKIIITIIIMILITTVTLIIDMIVKGTMIAIRKIEVKILPI